MPVLDRLEHGRATPDDEQARQRAFTHPRSRAQLLLAAGRYLPGTSPSQAAKSRPFANVSAGGAIAVMAVAVVGPIPGMVISRARPHLSGLDARFPIPALQPFAELGYHGEHRPCCLRLGFADLSVLKQVRQHRKMGSALGRRPAILGEVPADRNCEAGGLLHGKVAGARYQRRSLLLLGLIATKRMFGRCAASQIAPASTASFLCRFTIGFTYAGGISCTP